MADLTGTYFANNYMVAQAPFTQFGTRRLAIFQIWLDIGSGNHPNFTDGYDPNEIGNQYQNSNPVPFSPNSLYMRALRGVQLNAEIYANFEPYWDVFTVMIAEDTGAHPSDDPNYNSQRLADAVYQAIGGEWDVYVNRVRITGDEFSSMSSALSVAAGSAPAQKTIPADAINQKGLTKAEADAAKK